jgi:hypothetical protein
LKKNQTEWLIWIIGGFRTRIEEREKERKRPPEPNWRSVPHTPSQAQRGHRVDSNATSEARVWPLGDIAHTVQNSRTPATHWCMQCTRQPFFVIIFTFTKIPSFPSTLLIITKKTIKKYIKKPLQVILVIFAFKGTSVILMFWKKWKD